MGNPETEQHPAARGAGHVAQQAGAERPVGKVEHVLHQRIARRNGLGDLHQFVGVSECAGNGAAIRQHMGRIAVGGEAHRTLVDGMGDDVGHLPLLILRGLLLDRPLAHDVEAHRAVAHHAGDVDGGIEPVDGVEIAAVVLPIPGQAIQNGVLGNVLHGLHHARQQFLVGWLAGGESDPAIAHKRCGYAVPTHRRQVRVPANLGIKMGVDIYKSRGHHLPFSIDFPLAAP